MEPTEKKLKDKVINDRDTAMANLQPKTKGTLAQGHNWSDCQLSPQAAIHFLINKWKEFAVKAI